MSPHPLCNKFSLQSGTMAVAILDIVGGTLMTFLGFMLLFLGMQGDTPHSADDKAAKTIVTVFSLVLIFFGGFSVVLSYRLYKGAKMKNIRKCQIWLIIAILGMLMVILQTLFGSSSVVGSLVGLIFQGYCLWIVWAFIQEMKMEQETGGGCISGP